MSGDMLHIALVGPLHAPALAHHLNNSADIPDGPPTPVNELAEGLLALGHRVSLYTQLPAATTTTRLSGDNLDVTFIPYRTRARSRALDFFKYERRALERELEDSTADIVHVHWTYELAIAALKSGKKPLLVTAHDAPLTILRRMPDAYRLIRTAMAIRARLGIRDLTAVSPYLAKSWRRTMLYRRPIPVISNILPDLPTAATSSVRSPWVILDVANGSRLKNVSTLIQAFAMVRGKYPEAELRLVGAGLAAGDPTAEWARSRGLGRNITFVGPVDRANIANEYARASVFCHTSLEESLGVALLEALHAGLVVIGGASSGAVPWTLFNGRAGILADVKSASAVAEAIESALARAGNGFSTGPDLARAIEARHGRASVVRDYVAIYRRLIGEADSKRIRSAE